MRRNIAFNDQGLIYDFMNREARPFKEMNKGGKIFFSGKGKYHAVLHRFGFYHQYKL
jgi:hypothetical protein